MFVHICDLVGVLILMFGIMAIDCICSLGCPYGWTEFGQSCYMMVIDKQLDWHEARQVCLDAGSDLAVPNSEAENEYVWNIQKETINENDTTKGIWLGCSYDIEVTGQWQCYGDDKNQYNNLRPTQINKTGCVRLLYVNKEWLSRNCFRERHFLCERRCTTSLRCFAVTKDSGHHAQPNCLLGHTFKKTLINSPIQCCLACSKDPNCRSFNLSGKMCQLNNATISQVDADKYLVVTENCAYYEYE